MTEEFRLRCPKCKKLRKGFTLEKGPYFLTREYVSFILKCVGCGHEFLASYGYVESSELPEKKE